MQENLKNWFDEYTRKFDSPDPMVQKAVDLKREHTLRVCANIVDIGRSISLCEEDLFTAEISALLHDIGRFEQYRKYRTFSDSKSEDHASLGISVICVHELLGEFTPETAEIIVQAVKYHNRASLPGSRDQRFLFFLKMLRDADKLDIWRVVTDYYHNSGKNRDPAIELNLPDIPRISDKVYDALLQGRTAKTADVQTLNDLKLLQISWIYDLNFPRTFELVREKGYIKMLCSNLPKESVRVEKICSGLGKYL